MALVTPSSSSHLPPSIPSSSSADLPPSPSHPRVSTTSEHRSASPSPSLVTMDEVDNTGVIEISSDDEAFIVAEVAAAKAKRHAKQAAKKVVAEAAAANKIVTRHGPKTKGSAKFDECCVYGNMVALNCTQVLCLNKLAKKKPTLPVYVCTMQLANTKEPKAKMYFPRDFTNANIREYKDFPTKLRVYCGGLDEPILVSLIMSKGKGKGAQITTKWSQVVAATGMHNGDVFMFRFSRSPMDGLELTVKKVM